MQILVETNRLLIKVFEEADAEEARSFWGNTEVMMHCLGAIPDELLPKVIAAYRKCHEEKGLSVYAVVEKESSKVIGAAGFNVRTSLEKVELIYHIAKDFWGKGYATEAAIACIDYAKATKKVKLIYASADCDNTQSLKILEKSGLSYQEMKWFDDTEKEEPYYELKIERQ